MSLAMVIKAGFLIFYSENYSTGPYDFKRQKNMAKNTRLHLPILLYPVFDCTSGPDKFTRVCE